MHSWINISMVIYILSFAKLFHRLRKEDNKNFLEIYEKQASLVERLLAVNLLIKPLYFKTFPKQTMHNQRMYYNGTEIYLCTETN